MGYTEYAFIATEELQNWESIVKDFRKVVSAYEKMGFRLCGPDGEGSPIITDDSIRFNGDAKCRHSEFTFAPLPTKVKVVETPHGTFEYKPATFYCNGDCSHETGYLYRKAPYTDTGYVFTREEYRNARERWGVGTLKTFDYAVAVERGYGRKLKGYSIFVKTQRKPYTMVVQALFLIVRHYNPDKVFISSDGYPEDWEPAQVLVATECGYYPDLEFHVLR